MEKTRLNERFFLTTTDDGTPAVTKVNVTYTFAVNTIGYTSSSTAFENLSNSLSTCVNGGRFNSLLHHFASLYGASGFATSSSNAVSVLSYSTAGTWGQPSPSPSPSSLSPSSSSSLSPSPAPSVGPTAVSTMPPTSYVSPSPRYLNT